jgi:DNA-binding NarL/FixJ family response regulator
VTITERDLPADVIERIERETAAFRQKRVDVAIRQHMQALKPPKRKPFTGAFWDGLAERRKYALRLRKAGKSYQEIGAELGISANGAKYLAERQERIESRKKATQEHQ